MTCGVVESDEAKAAVEEYSSYIVEKRRQHSATERASSAIPDVMSFLLRNFSFQARFHAFCIFKFCCLVIALSQNLPAVTIDIKGSAIDSGVFDLCLLVVRIRHFSLCNFWIQ